MAAITQPRPSTPAVRTPVFIVGVGLALLAFLLMLAFGAIFASRGAVGAGQVRVVVAAVDIDQRQPITPQELTYATVASNSAVRAITRTSDLDGYSALVNIYKGQVITSNVVSSNPDLLAGPQSAYLPIPEGYVAMALPTNEQQGVEGYIAQGDYMNVIVTLNTSVITPVNPRSVTRTVFTNVKVIRVGPDSNAPRQSGVAQGISSGITVLMSLCDAQYMEWFLKNTTEIKYVLLAYPDYATGPSGGGTACPSTTKPAAIGPAAVDEQWGFTRA